MIHLVYNRKHDFRNILSYIRMHAFTIAFTIALWSDLAIRPIAN